MRRLALRRRLAGAGILLALVTGCVVTTKTPSEKRSPREDRLAELEDPRLKEDYESHWRAAQLCYEIADEDQEKREKSQRLAFVRRGLAHAEKACKLKPELVEGHFYKLICLGRSLELSTPSPVLVADLRDEGERTARIDERFECSGAHRFLGIFYSEAPESGPYGYGDIEKAEDHFQKALRIAGDCPENLLAYAHFQSVKMENASGAIECWKKALEVVDGHPGLSPEQRESFKKKARAELEAAEKK